jgi:hypothetical protein
MMVVSTDLGRQPETPSPELRIFFILRIVRMAGWSFVGPSNVSVKVTECSAAVCRWSPNLPIQAFRTLGRWARNKLTRRTAD